MFDKVFFCNGCNSIITQIQNKAISIETVKVFIGNLGASVQPDSITLEPLVENFYPMSCVFKGRNTLRIIAWYDEENDQSSHSELSSFTQCHYAFVVIDGDVVVCGYSDEAFSYMDLNLSITISESKNVTSVSMDMDGNVSSSVLHQFITDTFPAVVSTGSYNSLEDTPNFGTAAYRDAAPNNVLSVSNYKTTHNEKLVPVNALGTAAAKDLLTSLDTETASKNAGKIPTGDMIPLYVKNFNDIGEYVTLSEMEKFFDEHKEVLMGGKDITITEKITNRLPGDYQEVDYIVSSGSSYINTGIYPNDTMEISIDFYTRSIGSFYLIGSRIGSGEISYGIGGRNANHDIIVYSHKGGLESNTGTSQTILGSGTSFNASSWIRSSSGLRCQVMFSRSVVDGQCYVYVEAVDVTNNRTYNNSNLNNGLGDKCDSLNTLTHDTQLNTIYVFCLNPSNILSTYTRIHSFTIKDKSSNTVLFDGIPCFKHNNDGSGEFGFFNGAVQTEFVNALKSDGNGGLTYVRDTLNEIVKVSVFSDRLLSRSSDEVALNGILWDERYNRPVDLDYVTCPDGVTCFYPSIGTMEFSGSESLSNGKIISANVKWGNLYGRIHDQVDLMELLEDEVSSYAYIGSVLMQTSGIGSLSSSTDGELIMMNSQSYRFMALFRKETITTTVQGEGTGTEQQQQKTIAYLNSSILPDSPVYVMFEGNKCYSAHPEVPLHDVLSLTTFQNNSGLFLNGNVTYADYTLDADSGESYLNKPDYPLFISDDYRLCINPNIGGAGSTVVSARWRLLGYLSSKLGYLRLICDHPWIS